MIPWIKLHTELLTDPQWLSLPEVHQCRWIKLLLLRGYGELAKLSPAEIALGLRISLRQLEVTKGALMDRGWIDDAWNIRTWEARQQSGDRTAAERMRRHRRHVARNGAVTSRATADRVTPNAGEPLHPRARESREEESRGEEIRARARAVTFAVTDPPAGPDPPDPPEAPALDPELARLARLAGDGPGGAELANWVLERGEQGHAPDRIAATLSTLDRRGAWRRGLADTILADPATGRAGRGAGPRRDGTAAPLLAPAGPPRPGRIPDGPAGDPIRETWEALGDAGDRDAAEAASRGCPYCGGEGWAPLVPRSRGRSATTTKAYCLCPAGQWMRDRAPADLIRRMPDLAEVLEGKTTWMMG